MYTIAALFAYALAIFLERSFYFWIKWKKDPRVQKSIQAGDIAGAAHFAGSHPVASLIVAGNGASKDDVWDALAVASPTVETRIMRQISLLAAIGNIATMIGLLGTVYGLIIALDPGSTVDTDRIQRLSAGISVAMITTAWGLIAGVPAMAAHAVLSSKARDILAYCESVAAMIALQKQK